ncbi:hypothetical protein [Priestia koreensis]|uniref:hypothetical protein n=1 Tax=Priestia koreensis TaxID=284581 RepID=UPI001F560F6F|nr:hypothetical protein [Priestia koreensis]MCM3003417.1 hypothetical protein [Priestia koreensis]UNL86209.1 hypothetical protein IE339_06850 [Priestia koreensis]
MKKFYKVSIRIMIMGVILVVILSHFVTVSESERKDQIVRQSVSHMNKLLVEVPENGRKP